MTLKCDVIICLQQCVKKIVMLSMIMPLRFAKEATDKMQMWTICMSELRKWLKNKRWNVILNMDVRFWRDFSWQTYKKKPYFRHEIRFHQKINATYRPIKKITISSC